eukprot:Skav215217  [mRNA]  locus=scaffold341:90880:104317:+ [translate_table: standard]
MIKLEERLDDCNSAALGAAGALWERRGAQARPKEVETVTSKLNLVVKPARGLLDQFHRDHFVFGKTIKAAWRRRLLATHADKGGTFPFEGNSMEEVKKRVVAGWRPLATASAEAQSLVAGFLQHASSRLDAASAKRTRLSRWWQGSCSMQVPAWMLPLRSGRSAFSAAPARAISDTKLTCFRHPFYAFKWGAYSTMPSSWRPTGEEAPAYATQLFLEFRSFFSLRLSRWWQGSCSMQVPAWMLPLRSGRSAFSAAPARAISDTKLTCFRHPFYAFEWGAYSTMPSSWRPTGEEALASFKQFPPCLPYIATWLNACAHGEGRHLDNVEQRRFYTAEFRYPSAPSLVITASRDGKRCASTWAFNAVRLLFRQAKEACDSYWLRQAETDVHSRNPQCAPRVSEGGDLDVDRDTCAALRGAGSICGASAEGLTARARDEVAEEAQTPSEQQSVDDAESTSTNALSGGALRVQWNQFKVALAAAAVRAAADAAKVSQVQPWLRQTFGGSGARCQGESFDQMPSVKQRI